MAKAPGNRTESHDEALRDANQAGNAHADAWYASYRTQGDTEQTEDQSLHFLMRLFDDAPAPYIVTDDQLVIIKANAAAQRLLNRPLRALNGKPLSVMIAPSDLKAFRRSIKEAVMDASSTINRPLRIRPAGSKAEREAWLSASVLRNGAGEAEYVCWILSDRDRSLAGDIL